METIEKIIIRELRTCGSFNDNNELLGLTLRFGRDAIYTENGEVAVLVNSDMRKIYKIIDFMSTLGRTKVTSYWIPREGVNTIKEAYAHMQLGYNNFLQGLLEDRASVIEAYIKGEKVTLASTKWPVVYLLDMPNAIVVDGDRITF